MILNARFLNKNLGVAVDMFNTWEQELAKERPECFNRLHCLLINIRKNFDAGLMHTEEINQWLQEDEVLISLYSEA